MKTNLSILSFKRNRLPYGIWTKHKSRLCVHGGTKKWGVNQWETYSPVVNLISARSLLAIASIHELKSISIEFVLAFTQSDLDVDVFMDIPLGMEVYVNIREWVINLNKSIYGLNKESSN